MSEKIKTPQLRVCVTPNCNLSCKFCRPGGEGYEQNLHDVMTYDEIIKVLKVTQEVGFDCVKFTGGEPLLRKEINDLINDAAEIGFEDIQMVTNGTLLKEKAKELSKTKLTMLTVSLDGIDNESYRAMRNTDVYSTLEGIKEARKLNIPVRINTIITKTNLDQLDKFIAFAKEYGCSLKLLDLIRFTGMEDEWEKEYLDFDYIRDYLKNLNASYIGKEEAPGGIGTPLSEFILDNKVHILLKDSTRGTFYHESCKDCKNYPCQDALISVRVTHDGKLKRCLARNDNMVDILSSIREGNEEEAVQKAAEVFDIMIHSEFYPFAWKYQSILTHNCTKEEGTN